jgi:hypothetical protein
MKLTDLTGEFSELVKGVGSTIEFKARFWGWLDVQRRGGPLQPLLEDMERHWSSVGAALSLSEARDILPQLAAGGYAERIARIGERFRQLCGALPAAEVVLLAGLERPEGYSRFDLGRNTIFLGLDHPTALSHSDHLELILSHELCHAVRDPDPAVLADYGGDRDMSHDEFVARHPFREHLVSEALATSVSEAAYPGRPERRYVYFAEDALRWCQEHRREIAERMLLALEREEPYRTFYSEGSVTPDSPDCCDYWFGLHLGRFALTQAPAGELLRLPATAFLDRYLAPFVEAFTGDRAVAVKAAEDAAPRSYRPLVTSPGEEPLEAASLPESVRQVYDEYAALLARRPTLARELDERLTESAREARLDHAGEPWDVHAFPLLLSAEEERHLRWATDGLLRLIEEVIDLYREDREVRAFFAFPRHVEELCLLEPGFRPYVTLGRLDSYWSGRRARFLELNCSGTSLWCLAELLGDEVLLLPGLGEILARHEAETWPLTSRMFDGLLSAWRQARGTTVLPRRIAIVDWRRAAMLSEQERLAERFSRMGVPTDRLDPAELRFEGGELRGPLGPIDLVYRRLTAVDLIERHHELGPLLDAARAGAVVTAAAYASDVAHSKRLFAFLTHERWQRRLSPAQRALVDAHVPWTRMFVPGMTQYEGRRRDLRELALAARERFVLKPAEGYEGRDVLLGAETDPARWEAEVDRRFGGAHVLQEAVRAPLRRLLLPRGRRVEEVSRWLHLGEFVIGGQLAGFLARTSEELVLAADSREHTLPCLVLADDAGQGQDQDLGPAAP